MNQTDVRTFKAASMQEALEIVRREMGPDAVILHTREIPAPRFLKWRKSSERVEVTAGTGVNIRPARPLRQPAGGRTAPPPEAPAHNRPAARQHEEVLAPPPPLLRQAAAPQPRFSLPAGARDLVPAAVPAAYQAGPVSGGIPENIPARTAPAIPAAGTVTSEPQTAIARQLTSIQEMVARLTRESLQKAEDIPADLFQLYTELIDVEVEEDLARELIDQLKKCASSDKPADAAPKARLRTMVEGEIRCAPPIVATPGRRRVVALVGPTGVGKTTTIAKLAANFRLRDGIRMGLVTVDTYRIAAVEQLRTYAEIIDLPMKVVTSPREMRRALDELSGLDLVLIDTAGRSPRDELKIQELKSLLSEAQVDEVHLVLSLVTSPRSLQATAEKFAPAGTTAMILTKLDEAVGMGSLLSVSRRVPLPVSYLTTGQDVPDDIEHASARRVARLVLGEESLFARRKAA
jgi:flagellar biosynthesis protein FlhF